jgi:hypothetical protein
MKPTRAPAAGAPDRARASWRLAVAFLVAFAVLPVIVVFIANGTDRDAFVCRVTVKEPLGATLGGKLEFLLVDTLDGRPPAKEFVVTLDHGYTRGIAGAPSPPVGSTRTESVDLPRTPVGTTFSLEGTLMDRDVFYGDQYLFFGYPQLYVSQVKAGLLWPSQIGRLGRLYLTPFVSLVSVCWVWMLPFAEEYSLSSWLLGIGRFVLVVVAVAAAIIWRRKRKAWTPGVVWVAGIYVLLTLAFAIPDL